MFKIGDKVWFDRCIEGRETCVVCVDCELDSARNYGIISEIFHDENHNHMHVSVDMPNGFQAVIDASVLHLEGFMEPFIKRMKNA